MDVREREDLPGGGDLPGGLSFLPDDEPPPPPGPRGWGGRLLRLLLVVAVLGATGVVGVRWAGEQDVRDVLASSTLTYAHVLDVVSSARDPQALANAAALAPRSAERLEGDLSRLRDEPGERRAAVAAQVAAERDVVLALAPLERLADGPLDVWGRTSEALAAAVDAEARTRSALRVHDGDAARALPDTAAALRRMSTTAGGVLVEDVQRSAGELLDGLAAAARTADLRAAAERAVGQRTAVQAAEDGLGPSGDAAVLAAFGAALQAVQDLQPLTPADTSAWPGVRARIAEHLRFVADSDDGLVAGSVRARLPLVLTAVDGVVARAEEAHAAWQPVHDAAVAQQAADRDGLARAREAVAATGTEVTRVRAGLTALLAAAPDAAAAARELAGLESSADLAAAELRGAVVPVGTEDAHAGLLRVVEALAAPLAAAHDELRLSACQDCPAADAATWSALAAAAQAAGGWEAAVAGWESAVAQADAAVAARVLPPPPDV